MVLFAVVGYLVAAAGLTAEAMHFDDAPETFHPIEEAHDLVRIGISAKGQLSLSDALEAVGARDQLLDEPGEPEELVEAMPLHQNLGVHFLPDNGEELKSMVANLSDAGLQARYSVEEMEKSEPTPWKAFWNREVCVEKREAQKKDDYFLVCHTHAPVIWTPKHKLAYMKTPKAASTAFWYFFKEHFSDSEEISPTDLPNDAYVFTFAREPFEQKLAGFAEVDLKTQAGKETTLDSSTTFQHVAATEDNGKPRFEAFLDDIWQRRFHAEDARKPGHAGNQVGGALCSHSVNFFGHLEHLTTDWDQIQTEAKLPQELRTKALPVVHADTSETHERYKYDEGVPLSKDLKEKMCMIYRSEFACLGYDAPTYCQKYGLP